MKLLKRIGVVTAALVVAGAGLIAMSAVASAQEDSRVAAIPTPFILTGVYSDGGAALPEINRDGDNLRVDMSSQGRPPAPGRVTGPNSIEVDFPDDRKYTATLEAPGTIRWSNGSAWYKAVPVPNVIGMDPDAAAWTLSNAGFRVGSVTTYVDRSCNFIDLVGKQHPRAGALAGPGSSVRLEVGKRPPLPCP